ncbi:hypothetical protein KSP40_PGU011764 [Platanthera guangdongensis]|uniref:Uncharacterized protein n=1 Tax=Platanthera guangdongensis TaxID=2320717 RepID=A0ABR2LVI8_9ASPA
MLCGPGCPLSYNSTFYHIMYMWSLMVLPSSSPGFSSLSMVKKTTGGIRRVETECLKRRGEVSAPNGTFWGVSQGGRVETEQTLPEVHLFTLLPTAFAQNGAAKHPNKWSQNQHLHELLGILMSISFRLLPLLFFRAYCGRCSGADRRGARKRRALQLKENDVAGQEDWRRQLYPLILMEDEAGSRNPPAWRRTCHSRPPGALWLFDFAYALQGAASGGCVVELVDCVKVCEVHFYVVERRLEHQARTKPVRMRAWRPWRSNGVGRRPPERSSTSVSRAKMLVS